MTKVFLSLLLPALGIFTSAAAASNTSPKEMAIPGIELSADTSVTLKKSAHLPKDTVVPASPATLLSESCYCSAEPD